MWVYEKKLQYPVNITTPNPDMAKMILSQYGGPDGELAASLRYLNQRYTMPTNNLKGLLTDIGTEELAHLEMIATIVYKLTKDSDLEEIQDSLFAPAFVDHGKALFYVDAASNPFTATYIQAKDDPIADLTEDMAADAAFT